METLTLILICILYSILMVALGWWLGANYMARGNEDIVEEASDRALYKFMDKVMEMDLPEEDKTVSD